MSPLGHGPILDALHQQSGVVADGLLQITPLNQQTDT